MSYICQLDGNDSTLSELEKAQTFEPNQRYIPTQVGYRPPSVILERPLNL